MSDPRYRSLARAWIFLCLALVLHVADEAATGFLSVYNPTVTALRQNLGWWPMPTFEFREWLWGLLAACVILLALSVEALRGAPWMRYVAAIFAALMLLNAAGHTLFTILGHTVSSVTFSRPAPGFWSSPFLAAAAVYMFGVLRRTRAPNSPALHTAAG